MNRLFILQVFENRLLNTRYSFNNPNNGVLGMQQHSRSKVLDIYGQGI